MSCSQNGELPPAGGREGDRITEVQELRMPDPPAERAPEEGRDQSFQKIYKAGSKGLANPRTMGWKQIPERVWQKDSLVNVKESSAQGSGEEGNRLSSRTAHQAGLVSTAGATSLFTLTQKMRQA